MIRLALNLALIGLFLSFSANVIESPWMNSLENKIYDFRLNQTKPNTVDPRVVIIDIDEKSLKTLGRWPWNRKVMANLVDILFDHYYVQVLGFDILFAEKDNSSGLDTLAKMGEGIFKDNPTYLQTLEQLKTELNYDQQFADSLRERDIVLGYFFRNQVNENARELNTGLLPAPLETVKPFVSPIQQLLNPTGYGANLPMFQQAAVDGGFIDIPTIDADGVARTAPLVQHYEGGIYGSFALEMTRAVLGFPPIEPVYADYANENGSPVLEAIKLDEFVIPTTDQGIAYIPYRGNYPSYTYISVNDVMNKTVDPDILDGAIVLMGTTATGLLDMRATPVQNVYPGVEIHANIISGILDDTIKLKPYDVIGLSFVTHLIVGVLMMIALARLKLVYSLLLTLSLVSAMLWGNYYTWQVLNYVTPVVSPVLMILSLFILHIAYGYFIEDSNKRKLNKLFGQYVPPELVDEMNNTNKPISLKGETREMTVLFSDIRGFTSLSEQLDPEQLTTLMNEYLTAMTKIIHQNRGTVDKYIGDAIMAFWGAPLIDEAHARHAMQAAMDMQNLLPELNESFKRQGFPAINIGVGLNTGKMNVGNMGSEFRMAYTVLGDAVNLSSRLESITKQYGVTLIVSESTKDQAPDWIYQEIDLVKVVGKKIPISIYRPISKKFEINARQQKEMYLFKLAVKLYRAQQWHEAKKIIEQLKQLGSGLLLYQMYLERIAANQKNPPSADWDGVFEAKSK